MKKYKHRRTGIIVEMGVANKNYYYAYKENEAIIKWVVEDSLDWEEVKESNFLITSFKNILTESILKHDTQLKDMYCLIDGKRPFYEKQDLLESHQTIVYSIKNSKGEEFTIGDKVMSLKDIFTISKFEIYTNEVIVYFKETIEHDGLEAISKYKTQKYSIDDIEEAYNKVSSTFMITYANFIKELKKIREND